LEGGFARKSAGLAPFYVDFLAFPQLGGQREGRHHQSELSRHWDRFPEDARRAKHLADFAEPFVENETLPVDLMIRLPPFIGPDHSATGREPGKFVPGGDGRVGLAGTASTHTG
jgi:hypothetical protein